MFDIIKKWFKSRRLRRHLRGSRDVDVDDRLLELEARHGSPLAEGQPRRRRCQRELVTPSEAGRGRSLRRGSVADGGGASSGGWSGWS